MLSNTILTILALAGSFVSATPTTEAQGSKQFEKRAAGGVYICTDANWSGKCGYQVQPLNTCIPLDFPWWHAVSSFGPDQGTKCDLYEDYNCGDGSILINDVGSPGYADLTAIDSNDLIGSFICRT